MTFFDIGYITDAGNKRRVNQDRVGAFSNSVSAMVVIADGMGGMYGGEAASQIVIDNMEKWWNKNHMIISNLGIKNISESIYDQIVVINNQIVDYSKIKNARMGTTLTVLYINNNNAILVYSGDTRAYAIGNNKVKQLTQDESLYNYIKKYKNGIGNSLRNKSILFSYLGKSKNIAVNTKIFSIKNNDKFVICTDGFYNYLDLYNEDNIRLINTLKSSDIVKIMLRKVKLTEASDNISLAVIKCKQVT